MATGDGIDRFDGRHFEKLKFAPGVATAGMVVIAEASDGALWAGVIDGVMRIPADALDRFGVMPGTVYHIGPKELRVSSMRFTRSGVLWVGTNKGLYRMERETFVPVATEDPITRVEEGVDGHLLVTTTHGFMELDGDRRVDHPDLAARLGVPKDKIYHVIEDHLGGRWFCTSAGVAHQTGKSLEKLQPFGVPGVEALRSMEDTQGNVWIALSTGLFRARNGVLEPMSVANPRAIGTDRDGALWVGTNGGGLVRFENRAVRMFSAADGLPNEVTIATLTGSDGKLWTGNNCGGLSWFDGHRFHVYSEKDGLTSIGRHHRVRSRHKAAVEQLRSTPCQQNAAAGKIFVHFCVPLLFMGRKGLKRKLSKSPGSGRNAPADLLCEAHSTRDAYCSGRLILPSHTSLAALQILTTNSHHVREITGTHATADRKLDILQQPPSPPLLLEPVDRDLGFPRPVAPQQQPEQTIICPITMRRVSRGGRVCIFMFLLPAPTRDRIGVHSRTQ